MKIRILLTWATLGLIILIVNFLVIEREHIRSSEQVILLHLEPADPRSLVQGDYMRLDYSLLRTLRQRNPQHSGRVVLSIDPQTHQGTMVGLETDSSQPLMPGQAYLNFNRSAGGKFSIGAESFFFQEGQADQFGLARYAGLRVAPDGRSVLFGLYDGGFKLLGEAK